jgi:CSLREA domain-containing protein
LNNSIVANSTGGDISGGPLAGGHNLTGSVALGPLQDNGGPTPTMALPAGSPAIDAGDASVAPATDQRGAVGDAHPDIGAFEVVHTLVVTTLSDEDDGSPDPSAGSGTSLREALAFANKNPGADTITFAPGLTGTIRLALGQLPGITDDLTITAPGAAKLSIDAHGASRVFQVNAGATVSLSGLTIANGSADHGGGIRNDGTLTLSNSTLSGNHASIDGGSIGNFGTLTLTHSTLNANSARYGGAVRNGGTATVTDSTFSGNTAGQAGAIENAGTMTLTGSTLWGNSATNGGAIRNGNNLTVLNSTLAGNAATVEGGGIYNNFGTLAVTSSTLSGNTAPAGGGIFGVGTLTLNNSIVANGGGLDLQGPFSGGHNLTGTVALGALADNGGPTPTMALPAGSPAIDAGDASLAPATDQRGAPRDAHPDIGAFEVVHSIVVTTLVDEDDGTPDPSAGAGTSLREAIAFADRNPGADTISFAPGLTGTIRLALGQLPALTDDATLSGPGASNLTIDAHGASRVLQIGGGATVRLSGLTIVNGSADHGGGIDNLGTLAVTSSTLSGNSASFGGGITNDNNGTLAVTNSTLSGNSASFAGGGIANYASLAVTSSTLSGNSASYGAGIANSTTGTLAVTNSILSGNSASVGGGGIANNGTLAITTSTLSGNSAGRQGGGGITNDNNGTLAVTNSTLSGNSASFVGGGIFNIYGRLAVTNSTLSGNSASVGGGIANSSRGTLTLNNSIVANSPSGSDVDGDYIGGHNLLGTVALGPLANNGGPIQTMALPAGSPAIDAGDNALAVGANGQPLTTDQRGAPFARIQAGTVDIGAFESQATATAISASPSPSTYGQVVTFTAKVTSGASLVTGGTVTFTEGSTVLATVPLDASGQASFTTATLSAGSHSLTASFTGATGLHSSSASVAQTVKKATLGVVANTVTRPYGTANPAFTVHYTGFVNGDTAAVLSGSPGLTGTATLTSPPGRYGILVSPGTLAAANYQFRFVNAPLYVVPAVLTTQALTVHATAGAPFSGTVVTFTTPDTIDGPGSFTATITWGDGSTSAGAISGSGGAFTVSGTHTYADPVNKTVRVTISHNNGYTTTAHTIASAVVTNLGVGVQHGQAASITFWQSSNGQALINSFNGDSTSTALGNWLAATLPNVYGAGAGASNLTGMTNTQVANFYQALFALPAPQADAEVLATALNVYATTQSLGGNAGTAYGFAVTANGLGASSFNVGADGAAFGVANNTTRNVYELLLAANQRAVNGVLYNGDATLRQEASDLFDALNSAGSL